MARTLLASLLGAVILVVWGMLAWVALPLHKDTLQNLPNEDAVVTALQALPGQAVYIFPGMPKDRNDKAAMDAYTQKYAHGPMGMIVYDPRGGDPFMVSSLIYGLIIAFLSALIATWAYQRSTAITGTFIQRVSFFGMFGLFLALAGYFNNWNWMGYPLGYTTSMALDTLIAWLLAGLGIMLVVKAPMKAEIEKAVVAA